MKNGLNRVDELYRNRGERAKALHDEGKKVMGYLCCSAPLEFMTALDIVPYRMMGDAQEPITEADVHLETMVCSFIRSVFDMTLKGALSFCDGLVLPHSCDSVERFSTILEYSIPTDFFHFLDVPHKTDASSKAFFKSELSLFRRRLEDFTGQKLTDERLQQAVKVHNENRALIRELYALRQVSPPLMSGGEMARLLVASMSIPVSECNDLLRSIIRDVNERSDPPESHPARLLVYGAQVDDTSIIDLIEESGAHVVMDDLCIGSKPYWLDVPVSPDPLDGIVDRYLDKLECPRTFREVAGTYEEQLEERFGYIGGFVKDFKVDGVILYIYRYCDPFGLDAPDVASYLRGQGIPMLYLEDEYSGSHIAGLSTRVQAFLEKIE